MPVPAFEWKTYSVSVPRQSPLRAFAAAAPAPAAEAVTVEIPLPVIHMQWPAPIDKARILLESAAEIEHALMAQYLYAAYSLKDPEHRDDNVTEDAQIELLDRGDANAWFRTLLGIAREEMGHLMSVENLLLFTGQPPNFEREDFPPRKDIYPFKLHLEPLSQKSLAKYVVAESAIDEPDIEDIKEIAMEAKGGAKINHVGILYGLLGLIFSTKEQIEAGSTSADAWEKMLHGLGQVAKKQDPNPEAWHLPETAFHPESEPQQADPGDWQTPGTQPSSLRVHRVKARDEARAAIRDIAEQGEGPTSGDMTSHFMRFSGIYRKVYPLHDPPTLPPIEKWATRALPPPDPKPSDFTEPRTRLWAKLADLRYALLLGFLEHYLLTTGDDRQLLTGWIFSEMRSRLGYIAELLTKMPRGGGGVAAAPFSLLAPLHLPAVETGRWKVHMDRLELAIAKIQELQELQAACGSDATDEFLKKLLASDEKRLALVRAKAAAQPVTTSFERDILPLFRPIDIEHMIDVSGLDLSSYEEVKASVQSNKPRENILNRVQGMMGGIMPPRPHYPWTKAQIALLQRWKDEGFPR